MNVAKNSFVRGAVVLSLLAIHLHMVLGRAPASTHAGGGCIETYVVESETTIEAIVKDLNLPSLQAVLRIKPGKRATTLLREDDVVCLPPVTLNSRLLIEAEYQYQPADEEEAFDMVSTQGGLVGVRKNLPLQRTKAVILTGEGAGIASAMVNEQPLLLGLRNLNETGYTLVVISGTHILSDVLLSEAMRLAPHTDCISPAPLLKDAFGDPLSDIDDLTLTLRMEADDGSYFPFKVTRLDVMRDPAQLEACYTGTGKNERMGFAVFPSSFGVEGQNQLWLVFSNNQFGPPNGGRWFICSRITSSSRWGRFVRRYFGC